MEETVMTVLNIQTIVPPPLKIINQEDAGTTLVVHVIPVPLAIQDLFITVDASSLNAHPASLKRKPTLSTAKMLQLQKIFRIVEPSIPGDRKPNPLEQPGGRQSLEPLSNKKNSWKYAMWNSHRVCSMTKKLFNRYY